MTLDERSARPAGQETGSRARLTDRARRVSPWGGAVIGATALFVVVYGWLILELHASYPTQAFDFGIFDQGLWLLSRFKEPFVTLRGLNLFGDHASLIMIPMVPLFWLWDDPRALLLFTVAALATGGPLLYAIGRRLDLPGPLAAVLAIAFLLHPALTWATWWNFHPELMAIPLLLGSFLLAVQGRPKLSAAVLLVVLLVKEDAPLVVVPLAMWLALTKTWPRRPGAFVAVAAVAVFFIDVLLVLPAFTPTGELVYVGRYARFGDTLPEALIGMVAHPASTLGVLVSGRSLGYLAKMLLPLPLALVRPSMLLVGAPITAANLLSGQLGQQDIRFQYSAYLLAIVGLAAVLGARRLRTRAPHDASRLATLTIGPPSCAPSPPTWSGGRHRSAPSEGSGSAPTPSTNAAPRCWRRSPTMPWWPSTRSSLHTSPTASGSTCSRTRGSRTHGEPPDSRRCPIPPRLSGWRCGRWRTRPTTLVRRCWLSSRTPTTSRSSSRCRLVPSSTHSRRATSGDSRNAEGFAGVELKPEQRAVLLYWKGSLPDDMVRLINEVRSQVPVEVRAAGYSLSELLREARRIAGMDLGEAGVRITEVGPLSDYSGLDVGIGDAGDIPLAEAIIESTMKLVFTAGSQPIAAAWRWDDIAPFWGGAAMDRPAGIPGFHIYCTTGFAADQPNGDDFMITARHCGLDKDWFTPIGDGLVGHSINGDADVDAMLLNRGYQSVIYVGDWDSAQGVNIVDGVNPADESLVLVSGSWSGASVVRVKDVNRFINIDGQVIGPGIWTRDPQLDGSVGEGDSGGPTAGSTPQPANWIARGMLDAIDLATVADCEGLDEGRTCAWRAFSVNIDAIEAQLNVDVQAAD